MKKIFPSFIIVFVFGLLMVVQMLVHGQKLTANNLEESVEKYSVYENQFSKLKIKTTKGEEIALNNVESPIVILNFWASWCKPCIKEFKSLNALVKKYDSQIKVLGINNDDEDALKKVKKVKSEYNILFDSTLDEEGKIASLFNITSIPASIVYYKGKIIHFANKEFDFMSEDFINLLESKLN